MELHDIVDTLFCPNCLENMPSTEAKIKKNRCANCYDCPSCGHTLSVRAATIQVPNAEDASTPFTRKVYYLGCTCCRWTTRDVGLDDQTVATGGWTEKDGDNYERIQVLFEYYRAVAQREKIENERRKSSKKKVPYLSLSEKISLSSSFSSIISRRSLSSPYSLKEAVDEVEDLPSEIFTDEINLSDVTSIEQRLAVPDRQPELTKDLYPLHKHLLVKKSHRCRQCEHNLSKPEYNPSSIKFKIQLGAYYHVPELRLFKEVELKWGVASPMLITLCNPTPHDMTVMLLPYSYDEYFSSGDVQYIFRKKY
ncbi:Dynactin subunit 4 [Armadillidium nasatum]|uniref:Dynactin subunit 4 n=1 Tax=Armadillidium nasatum TaxID=96803 RepID=A0A5N5TGF2_9CRUS|nr:Dynactin subunit 4 [Armadillidium nasatum]